MIVVTGGAGFIGSNLHTALAQRGHETVIVDRLRGNDKWRNLAAYPPARLIDPAALEDFLASYPPVEMVFHLGAISTTTALDGDLVWSVNVELPLRLWRWCAARGVRFVYASSAATYGDGAQGFDDGLDQLARLRPRNLYGWSKHAFDLAVARAVALRAPRPPQWAGLKFFNVYGPNEAHKGPMISVVKVKLDEVRGGRSPRLFRSYRPDIADGEQRRDFVWVGDAVEVLLWLLDHPEVNGLFNLGTGIARSYRAVVEAVCLASGVAPSVEFIDMPAALHAHYQSFTEAPMDRLRAAGYVGQFTTLEDGVARYAAILRADPDPDA